ncbi:uncharacterized protein [Amphiura filiformis]|uniref:uncharacterized protein n=1 Tax=Amphiura filiformis TaxID=82378 RepID=UPI003B21E7B6
MDRQSSSSDQTRMPNPTTHEQFLQMPSAQFCAGSELSPTLGACGGELSPTLGACGGELRPTLDQFTIPDVSHPHIRQNVSIHQRASSSGHGRNYRSSWHGDYSGASAMPYPSHFRRGAPNSTYPRALPGAFPHPSTSPVRGHHPGLRNPHTLATIRPAIRHRRAMRMTASHEEQLSRRSAGAAAAAGATAATSEVGAPMSRRDLMEYYQQRRQYQQHLATTSGSKRGRNGFPTDNMIQIRNQMPNFPLQQTNQPNETEMNWDRFLEEPLDSSLPRFASAFIPRASSPGQFSTTSTNISEQQEIWMNLDELPDSPCPSDLSDSPSIEDIENMIFQEIRRGIINTCQEINISPDPYQWSIEEVDRWVRRTNSQYSLPQINMDYFHMDGVSLCNLTEEDFRRRAPNSDVIFSHLDVWKSAASQRFPVLPAQPTPIYEPEPPTDTGFGQVGDFAIPIPVPQIFTQSYPYNIKIEPHDDGDTASIASGSSLSDDQSIPSPTQSGSGPDTSMTPNHTGSIHLWQFLKELLLQPDSYGYCIRWLDRSQGIFKIEDSVKVATLWGRRKNRPAMNYDKMSRSIRQYYKKGIMKKTEVSQRLVYQFVKPC